MSNSHRLRCPQKCQHTSSFIDSCKPWHRDTWPLFEGFALPVHAHVWERSFWPAWETVPRDTFCFSPSGFWDIYLLDFCLPQNTARSPLSAFLIWFISISSDCSSRVNYLVNEEVWVIQGKFFFSSFLKGHFSVPWPSGKKFRLTCWWIKPELSAYRGYHQGGREKIPVAGWKLCKLCFHVAD